MHYIVYDENTRDYKIFLRGSVVEILTKYVGERKRPFVLLIQLFLVTVVSAEKHPSSTRVIRRREHERIPSERSATTFRRCRQHE